MSEELSRGERSRLELLFSDYNQLESAIADLGFEGFVILYRAGKIPGLIARPSHESMGKGRDFPLADLDFD